MIVRGLGTMAYTASSQVQRSHVCDYHDSHSYQWCADSYVTYALHTLPARISYISLGYWETRVVSGHILGSYVTDALHTASISYPWATARFV